MVEISNIIWIDSNVDNEENKGYLKELENFIFFKIKCFKDVNNAINLIKEIKFKETIIIISGKLYIEFIEKFKDNLEEIYIIPKIIIFCRYKDKLIKYNQEYYNILNHPFYNFGGIRTLFEEVKDFILYPINQKILSKENYNKKLDCPIVYNYSEHVHKICSSLNIHNKK